MEDVLQLYERPIDPREPVVCLDERPLLLHADVRAPRPARPGHVAKRDNEYERCGTANLFGIVEPKAGRHWSRVTPDRSGRQFAHAIRDLVAAYPRVRTIHLVLDNLNIHHAGSLRRTFGDRDGSRLWRRLTVHYTPKHGSWLNQAELELSLIARQALGRDRIPTRGEQAARVRAWNRRANRRQTRIDWRFTRKAARAKFKYHPHDFKRSKP
ncbi:MAG: IS630 family transposase [Gemmatimonadaceae bacterium]